ncbi:hypothetical protein [Sphingopyxis sp. H050]|uniref:hypothetical protein n=1 Tax=Sphingopyxis sp. H050 TaxID=1759072 RepID=UPI000B2BC309|nr:hypothetical protein [Sphingopyxis sp. H050]
MRLGGVAAGISAAVCWSFAGAASAAEPVVADAPAVPAVEADSIPAAAIRPDVPTIVATLPAGTVLFVMLDADLSTMTAKLGDRFPVVVVHDVIDRDTVVIPKGAPGYGEVTFTTNKGAFGKPGIIGITLRQMQIGDRQVALSGRYREEGANKDGATAATMFAVGVFSALIKGKPGVIPRGRELKARTGEPIAFTVGVSATPPAPIADTALLVEPAPAAAQVPPTAAPEPPADIPTTEAPTGGQQ